jgi:hypothetical protein
MYTENYENQETNTALTEADVTQSSTRSIDICIEIVYNSLVQAREISEQCYFMEREVYARRGTTVGAATLHCAFKPAHG